MNNLAVKHGLIYGIVSVIAYMLLWLAGPSVMFGFTATGTIILLAIGFYVFSALQARKEKGGFISFKTLFVHLFIVSLIAALIGLVFQYLLYNVIDPDLSEKAKQAAIENTVGIMEKMGTPQEAIDQATEQIEASEDFNMTIGRLVKNTLLGVVFGSVFMAIIAAVIKKKEPDPFA